MNQVRSDRPIYAALFAEGAIQEWIDKTAGNYLHELIGKGAESQLIDKAVGLGHRLKTGHDLQGFMEVTKGKGWDGSTEWFQHMFSDLMSPDGIPLPGASYVYRFLNDTIGVSEKFFIDWGCVSATDVLSGGLTLLLLARMHKIATEKGRILRLGTMTMAQVFFVCVAEANPFFLVTIPIQALLMRHEWKKWQLKRLDERLHLSERIADQASRLVEMAKEKPHLQDAI